jgi:sugar lactone lactonase YvrE
MNRKKGSFLVGSLALLTLLAPGCTGSADSVSLPVGGGDFRAPRAVAAGNGRIYALDGTGWLWVLDREGREQARHQLVKTRRGFPVGITIAADGSLLIADTHEARVLHLDGDGERIGTLVGGYGSLPGQFVYPQRIALAGGEMFVTEYGFGPNNRVQVFAADGRFLRTFGDFGTSGGSFARPCGVVVGPGDRVYVTDSTHRILVWTKAGRYLRDFGALGDRPGQLRDPRGLAADADYLYVCEYGNNRISRFTRAGGFAGTWGRLGNTEDANGLKNPRDVECSGGYLFIADTGNDRIVRVRLAGLPWRDGT